MEQEQNGASRAEYGKHVIEDASAALTEEFGKGFSETNIMNFKKFYLKFKELTIHQTLSEEFKKQKTADTVCGIFFATPKRSDAV